MKRVCFSLLLLAVACFAQAAPPVAVAGLPDLASLVEKASPAVVNISVMQKRYRRAYSNEAERQFNEFLFKFFGMPHPEGPDGAEGRRQPAPEVRRGMGSGFLTTPDGYILTNAHVVENADEVKVRMTDNREFTAKVIGIDQRTDIALLKIDGRNLPCLKLGKSATIRAGEWVVAIGSPFALDNTVTAGIISAKARETGDYLPLIQTDVAVNPGNSGGPLINMRGEVIGINSQIFSRSGGYMGISFAIPIDEAVRVSEQLKVSGHVTRGRIGMMIGEIPPDVAKALKLPEKQGVQVNEVDPDGPAAKAGIQAGDIVLAFNGQPVRKVNELPRLAGETRPGAKVRLTVWRKGATRDVAVTVGEADEGRQGQPEKAAPEKKQGKSAESVLGLAVTDLSVRQKRELELKNGVMITGMSQATASTGMKRGDVILRVNETDITSAAQFEKIVAALPEKKTVVLLVRRNDVVRWVPLQPAS
ncbi:MAG: DegQ family serine endoprotease [Burkholderiaceae bacterium]|nr:DegQ family serine endoprotease [Burkholderiaceae bacterium]